MTKYITSKEISEIAECNINEARKIKNEVNERIRKQGYRVVIKTKCPRVEVLKYLGLEDTQ